MSSEVKYNTHRFFHFSNKKHKDNFVFQIKKRIFANGIIKMLYYEVPNRNTKL